MIFFFESRSFKHGIFEPTKSNCIVFLLFVTYNVHSNVRMATDCVDSLFKTECAILINSNDVIGIDNYVILSTLQNLHFREYSIVVFQDGLKTCQT